MTGSVTLFNKHANPDTSWCDEVVSIMRPNILQNPKPITAHCDRESVLRHFDAQLDVALLCDTKQRAEIDRLAAAVASGKHIALMCCCTPKPCHGDRLCVEIRNRAKIVEQEH